MELDLHTIQDANWKSQTQLLAGLRGKIKGYLSRVSFVGGSSSPGAAQGDNGAPGSAKAHQRKQSKDTQS